MDEEKRIMKAVGILISELHSEYAGTRKIAMAQLILLGDKVVPHLKAFLGKELDLEKDLREYSELWKRAREKDDFTEVGHYVEVFRAKWEKLPSNFTRRLSNVVIRSDIPEGTDDRLIKGRLFAIESLLHIFEATEDKDGAEKTEALLTDFKEFIGPE